MRGRPTRRWARSRGRSAWASAGRGTSGGSSRSRSGSTLGSRATPGPKAVKIVLAKLGLDDHTRPLHVLAQGFRDAGMEVVFLGTHNTPAQVIGVALQEDVDAVVLSFHTLGHVGWLAEGVELLRERGGVGGGGGVAGGGL